MSQNEISDSNRFKRSLALKGFLAVAAFATVAWLVGLSFLLLNLERLI